MHGETVCNTSGWLWWVGRRDWLAVAEQAASQGQDRYRLPQCGTSFRKP